jgi:hypothetical protein
MDNDFYEFAGVGPVGGAFGYFGVNPWTGDVWSNWDCKMISTPASVKFQSQIRERLNANQLKRYTVLSKMESWCIESNDPN